MSEAWEKRYETVIGLEIHVQLATASKLFCGCAPRFGDAPNVHTCPVCLGLPGALPVLNREAVRRARLAALALGCRLAPRSRFARKHYFYPDLPKAYQISQYENPVGEDGRFAFWHGEDVRELRIVRVHLEEDAGKSTHRADGRTLVDLNRCGTPLIETVTHPDLRSPEEASDFLETLRLTMLTLGITDASMEEGSLRCDANISLRERGATGLNPKTELKNLNSFRHLRQALRHERARQAEMFDAGARPSQSTRSWDEEAGVTREMRGKEDAHDYRYFPDPDLVPVCLDDAERAALEAALPELPLARAARLQDAHGLSAVEARELVQEPARADYLEALVDAGAPASAASNWLRGPVQAWLNDVGGEMASFPLTPERLAGLLAAVEDGTVSLNVGRELLAPMIESGRGARELIAERGLEQVGDREEIERMVARVLAEHPGEVESFRDGNEKVVGFLMGQLMRLSGGKADPRTGRELLLEALRR